MIDRTLVESTAVLSIACISNKVNHVFNMTMTNSTSGSGITRRKAQLPSGFSQLSLLRFKFI